MLATWGHRDAGPDLRGLGNVGDTRGSGVSRKVGAWGENRVVDPPPVAQCTIQKRRVGPWWETMTSALQAVQIDGVNL